MNSLNHYAYGSVCEAIYSRIMGLKNAAPGWKKAVIAPKLNGQLRQSHIAFDSPAGKWGVDWRIADDGSVTLNAIVPEGCEAEIVLPDCDSIAPCTVSAGTYQWHWQPTKDLLHPFTAQTPVMDLLNHPEARAVLLEHTPAIVGICSGMDSEMRVMSPIEVAYSMPFLNPKDAFALDPLLKRISR